MTFASIRKSIFGFLTLALALVEIPCAFAQGPVFPQNSVSPYTRAGGFYYASLYNYGGPKPWSPDPLRVDVGNASTGSQTLTVRINGFLTTVDGDQFMPLNVNAPITVGVGTNAETVTPTAVSCTTPAFAGTCTVTASFNNLHGPGDLIASGSFGLQEAINRAFSGSAANSSTTITNGGTVIVDAVWSLAGGLSSTITAATPYQSVTIEDHRQGIQWWTPTQSISTILAAPTTLTSSTVGFGTNGANTTGGTYTGTSTYHVCIAYVDIMGNEGPCSADFSGLTAGTGSTNQIGFKAPAASTGAVGYTVYISLASGTYNLTYQVPITTSVCTMTVVETVTPACLVTNTTYGQTGSNAIVSALTVNTAPLHLLKTTASTTAAYIGTPSGRTTYAYAPHQQVSNFALTSVQQGYTISVAPATTVPEVIATIPVQPGLMNFVGKTVKICGQANEASAGSTATVQNFEILWDAAGSNTTGAPVIIGQLQLTATLVTSNADNWSFCWQGTATVTGSSVTAGTIVPAGGFLCSTYGAGVLGNCGVDVIGGAGTGSLNLAGTGGNTQRIHVVWLHTTGTDANGVTMQGLTVEVI